MVCIIHIGEPNRIPSPPTMLFLPIPMYVPSLKKNSLPDAMEKLLWYRNAISRISYTDTYHKPQFAFNPLADDIFPRPEIKMENLDNDRS